VVQALRLRRPKHLRRPAGVPFGFGAEALGEEIDEGADADVTVTAGRLKYACWDTDGGGGGGLESGWSLGGSGGMQWPTPQGCHIPENCPNPQPRNPQPPSPPRCPATPLPPASRNYPVPVGYSSAGYRNNVYVRNARGKLVNNPLYNQARAEAGGVNWRGVLLDLGQIVVNVGLNLIAGPIGSSRHLADVNDVARAGSLVGSSAVKTAGSPAVQCRR
jgi:hypothetical protein